MPQALGGYVKVYLYMLAIYQNPAQEGIQLEDIAKDLDMLYSELITALEYWNTTGVITFKLLTEDEFELSFAETKPEMETKSPEIPIAATAAPRTFIQQT